MQDKIFNCREISQFIRLDMIGEGTYGIVFIGKDKNTN